MLLRGAVFGHERDAAGLHSTDFGKDGKGFILGRQALLGHAPSNGIAARSHMLGVGLARSQIGPPSVLWANFVCAHYGDPVLRTHLRTCADSLMHRSLYVHAARCVM